MDCEPGVDGTKDRVALDLLNSMCNSTLDAEGEKEKALLVRMTGVLDREEVAHCLAVLRGRVRALASAAMYRVAYETARSCPVELPRG